MHAQSQGITARKTSRLLKVEGEGGLKTNLWLTPSELAIIETLSYCSCYHHIWRSTLPPSFYSDGVYINTARLPTV